ncbi:MAG: elongation factor Ts [Lachnospiraceae bacterium]|nr:elongation factor Ts [Lachnospiraceae bacterium]
MAISSKQVKELRDMTGAGMMDCKKALDATDGDMDKAVEFLREKGLAGHTKKEGRIAVEGLCLTSITDDFKKAAVVEVNCETDFAANGEKFHAYVGDVAAQVLNSGAKDLESFMDEKWSKDETLTVREALSQQISIISENMNIRRFEKIEENAGFVATYVHAGGKIGVLVDVETDVVNDSIKEMGKNVAMQIAAMSPKFTRSSEIDDEYIAHEKEIFLAEAKEEKPGGNEKIWNGIVMGRINKEFKEICLLDQIYVKAEDGKQSVQKYVESVAKENGAKVNIKGFVRFQTGEGMEKKEEDYAAEVAKAAAEARK